MYPCWYYSNQSIDKVQRLMDSKKEDRYGFFSKDVFVFRTVLHVRRSSRPPFVLADVDLATSISPTIERERKNQGMSELQVKRHLFCQKREDPYVACEVGIATRTPLQHASPFFAHGAWRAVLIHRYKMSSS
jgi:hypothetical protein